MNEFNDGLLAYLETQTLAELQFMRERNLLQDLDDARLLNEMIAARKNGVQPTPKPEMAPSPDRVAPPSVPSDADAEALVANAYCVQPGNLNQMQIQRDSNSTAKHFDCIPPECKPAPAPEA